MKTISRFIFILSFLLVAENSWALVGRDMSVIASGLNVRTADGTILCSIKNGEKVNVVGRHADGQRLKVKINRRGCPKEGYVYGNFLKPASFFSGLFVSSKVDVEALSLRSSPRVAFSTYRCALPKGTLVDIVNDSSVGKNRSQWFKVKVKNPPKGCPEFGFVNGNYLAPNEDFESLPEATDSRTAMTHEGVTEAQARCLECKAKGDPKTWAQAIEDKVSPQPGNDFILGIKEMMANPAAQPEGLTTHRGLLQIPLIGERGNIGPCGSHHYRPDRPVGIDAYASPVMACAFTSFLQDWKKTQCSGEEAGCRIAWGDISHRTQPRFGGHVSHTDGHCVDLRPLRRGAFADAPMTHRQSGYDAEKTRAMIQMLKEKGADVVLFNDRRAGGDYSPGHDNHVHVCFRPNPKAIDTCQNFQLDPNICPELD